MSSESRTRHNLTQAIASGTLPPDAEDRARHYLDLLQKPLRIALSGRPGAGKSNILNLLAGAEVLPQDSRLPSVELTYGDKPHAICTCTDGSKVTLPDADLHRIAALDPVFVALHLPLPALAKISVLKVAAPDDPAALHRASQWAAKRSDMVIWCSASFDAEEQAIWAQMPDAIKDSGLLLLTMNDPQHAKAKLDRAKAATGDDFHKIIAIAAKDAVASRKPDGSVDKHRMRDSGGTALIAAVLQQIARGKQTIIDMADLLLAQHGGAITDTPQAVAAPDTQVVCRRALDQITGLGARLVTLLDESGTAAPTEIMAMTAAQLRWLSDFLNDTGDDSDPVMQRLRSMAFDAADLVQLMEMEKRNDPVDDAVSLLLQVKRDLEAELTT